VITAQCPFDPRHCTFFNAKWSTKFFNCFLSGTTPVSSAKVSTKNSFLTVVDNDNVFAGIQKSAAISFFFL
jgi:hypothetical protein